MVAAWVRSLDCEAVLAACEAADAPCSKVQNIADIFQDAQFAARENLRRIEDPRLGTLVLPGPLPRMSRTPPELKTAGPALGDANERIWGGLLGLAVEQIAALKVSGVI